MRIFQCNKCGVVIPEEKILQNLEAMRKKGLISRKTEAELKQELEKEKPYIRCHNQRCNGLLSQADPKSLRNELTKKFET